MPRGPRLLLAGGYYHLINRGNDQSTVFHDAGDYRSFLQLMRRANERVGMQILAFCLMPNHFHVVASPCISGNASRWMHWLLTTHTHRYHLVNGTSGRVWQGRFKAFPIKADRHLLIVMRYVERNALRAGLVEKAEQWPWSSLVLRTQGGLGEPLEPPPITLPADWCAYVNEPQTPAELDAVRRCVNHQNPFGDDEWAGRLQWRPTPNRTTRRRGRPRRQK